MQFELLIVLEMLMVKSELSHRTPLVRHHSGKEPPGQKWISENILNDSGSSFEQVDKDDEDDDSTTTTTSTHLVPPKKFISWKNAQLMQ